MLTKGFHNSPLHFCSHDECFKTASPFSNEIRLLSAKEMTSHYTSSQGLSTTMPKGPVIIRPEGQKSGAVREQEPTQLQLYPQVRRPRSSL